MKSLLEGLGDEVTEAPSAFRKSLAGAGSPGDCSQRSQWLGMPPEWVTHRMTRGPLPKPQEWVRLHFPSAFGAHKGNQLGVLPAVILKNEVLTFTVLSEKGTGLILPLDSPAQWTRSLLPWSR